ncbi:MAG: HAD family hydrolase [Bacillota bacterium]
MRVTLVDVDGTLVDSQTYKPLTKLLWTRRRLRPRMVWLFLKLMPGHLRRNRSLKDRLASQNGWVIGYAQLLAGMTVEEAGEILRTACEGLMSKLRPEILRELEARRAEGHAIILASTSMAALLDYLGPMVKATKWVGTPLEVRDGRYTGRVGGPLCSGESKLHYIEDLLESMGAEVEWDESYAYSDGVPDLPMLEKVGHPVVVAPDPALAAEAVGRGWPSLAVEMND